MYKKQIIPGKTDLATIRPDLAAEWHPIKNGALKATDFTACSNKKVYWQCCKGHEWMAKIANRNRGTNCPYCFGNRVIFGQTDLVTLRPEIAAEWHSTRNGILKATDFSIGSGKKVYWKCSKGHEWKTSICERTRGYGCPYCSGKYVIVGETDLATKWPQIAAEWHPTRNGTINPNKVSGGSGKNVYWLCKKGHEWKASVVHRTKGNGCPYCSNKRAIVGETDLATKRPDLAAEWHPTKNGVLKATDFLVGSNQKVYWQCSKGHEWKTSILNRSRGTKCPYCSGVRIIVGETDLATLRPDLVTEWHPIKNGALNAKDVSVTSEKKVYWQCSKGHEWMASINNRNKSSGCPYCSGRRVIVGETDLATKRPDLAAEWHPTRNRVLCPTDVGMGSNKKVYWQCCKGHEWETSVSNRSRGRGCPYCSKNRVISGETDLATLRPDIAVEWHPTRNGAFYASEVSVNSDKKVFWLCKEGHEWKTSIFHRSEGTGCPYCSPKRIIAGKTDFSVLRPDLAKEWHTTLNGDLNIADFGIGNIKNVYWQCSKGHEWKASVANRIKKSSGCPYCSGKRVIIGETDLATKRPDLAAEWHPTLNGVLNATDVSVGSTKKVYWQCCKGHVWQATVSNRNYRYGCPYCSGRYAIRGETDLATLRPDLASEWHPSRNGLLNASEVCLNSQKKIYWLCKKGHEWQASVANRSKGDNCPYCYRNNFNKSYLRTIP